MNISIKKWLFYVMISHIFVVNSVMAQSTQDGLNAYQAENFEKAVKILTPLAENGDTRAQSTLGVIYYNGKGVIEDIDKAYVLFSRAASSGDIDAQFNLANLFLYDPALPVEVEDRDKEAVRWFLHAARQGHADAQYHLGLLLMAGTGVTRNTEEAYLWIHKAALQEHKGAQIFLGEYDE
ncbi:localization factor PodJL [bacterium BMS3Bbin11]|nr:localization factor PodJL [bacterium BMS3Abin11]GBE44970.1 localization factor PodJL [bacterium BMS3Bbin11]